MTPRPEWQPSPELAQAAIDGDTDDFAFWRGLAFGLCLSGCIWIAIGGGVWATFKGVF
jgi:hypothetical protein